jgi:hypothetical protein
MSKQKGIFKWIYLVWVTILIALVAAALSYVNNLLQDYEASQPELQVETAVARLAKDAAGSDFWSKYGLAQPEPGRFETEVDVGKTYLNYFRAGRSRDVTVQFDGEIVYGCGLASLVAVIVYVPHFVGAKRVVNQPLIPVQTSHHITLPTIGTIRLSREGLTSAASYWRLVPFSWCAT